MTDRSTNVGADHLYPPLDQSAGATRFVQILPQSGPHKLQCNLAAGNINDADYIAVSYEWGSAADPVLISVNSKPVIVRQNIYKFLLTMRKLECTKYLWIDALCIDQENIEERNRQVRQMGDIYSRAIETWVWLGEPGALPPQDVFRDLAKKVAQNKTGMQWPILRLEDLSVALSPVISSGY